MHIITSFGLSIRRSCSLIGISRTSFDYKLKLETEYDKLIHKKLKELAQKRKRFGYRRLYIMLCREGFMVNHKRI